MLKSQFCPPGRKFELWQMKSVQNGCVSPHLQLQPLDLLLPRRDINWKVTYTRFSCLSFREVLNGWCLTSKSLIRNNLSNYQTHHRAHSWTILTEHNSLQTFSTISLLPTKLCPELIYLPSFYFYSVSSLKILYEPRSCPVASAVETILNS